MLSIFGLFNLCLRALNKQHGCKLFLPSFSSSKQLYMVSGVAKSTTLLVFLPKKSSWVVFRRTTNLAKHARRTASTATSNGNPSNNSCWLKFITATTSSLKETLVSTGNTFSKHGMTTKSLHASRLRIKNCARPRLWLLLGKTLLKYMMALHSTMMIKGKTLISFFKNSESFASTPPMKSTNAMYSTNEIKGSASPLMHTLLHCVHL